MAERALALLLALTLIAAAGTQEPEPEFAVAPPAKVSLPLESLPAPETARGEAPPVDPSAPEATPDRDPLIEAIASGMEPVGEGSGPEGTGQESVSEGPAPRSIRDMASRGFMALCATLAVPLLGFAAWKRWGRRGPQLAGQELARVVGRVALSPQASLHFVQVNGEVLVVGVTANQINLLKTLAASELPAAPERAAAAPRGASEPAALREPASRFLEQLKETRAALGVEPAGDDVDLDQLKGQLQQLKDYFRESSRGRE